MPLDADAHGMPVRFLVTAGITADCAAAAQRIGGFAAHYLLADRGYDANGITALQQDSGNEAAIPLKKNETVQRNHDRCLYKLRHMLKNAFLRLKRGRGIAARYAKNTASFVAAVQIRCIAVWSYIC